MSSFFLCRSLLWNHLWMLQWSCLRSLPHVPSTTGVLREWWTRVCVVTSRPPGGVTLTGISDRPGKRGKEVTTAHEEVCVIANVFICAALNIKGLIWRYVCTYTCTHVIQLGRHKFVCFAKSPFKRPLFCSSKVTGNLHWRALNYTMAVWPYSVLLCHWLKVTVELLDITIHVYKLCRTLGVLIKDITIHVYCTSYVELLDITIHVYKLCRSLKDINTIHVYLCTSYVKLLDITIHVHVYKLLYCRIAQWTIKFQTKA